MRFVYKILIGLLIFNSMLLLFAPFFPVETTTISESATNITSDSEFTSYQNIGSAGMIGNMILTGGGVFAGAIVLGLLTQQLGLFIGAGSFIALISGLWVGASGVIVPILQIADNWIVMAMYSLITVIIGIVAVIAVVEMFTAQQGGD